MRERLEEVIGRPVSRETLGKIQDYSELLRKANRSQNLIAASTVESLWERHIIDSAQLVRFEPKPGASWLDIGSGAGLPGLVIAILGEGTVSLVEPRRLRAEFLGQAVDELGLGGRVTVRAAKVENLAGRFDTITARAVAPLDKLIGLANHLSHEGTVWALPKGRNAKSELAEAGRRWQCDVRVEASCTDPEARILVLSNVKAKSNR